MLSRPSAAPAAAPNAAVSAASASRRIPFPPARARKATTTTSAESAATAAAAADDGDAPLRELSQRRSAVVFSSPSIRRAARVARSQIDALFADPRTLDTRRLLDPFYVQDQYNLLRTQPGALLGSEAASAVTDALVEFAEEHLGLPAITPPWISFYLDGMGQELHVDAFQGPLAFVLPLSFWGDEEEEEEEEEDEERGGLVVRRRPRLFVGGETAILRHGVTRYWDGAAEEEEEEQQQQLLLAAPKPKGRRRRATSAAKASATAGPTLARPVDLSGGSFRSNRGQELDHLFARIPPRFGRLLVFDGRLPHGVRPVRSPTADPRDARIALHAWFAPPADPFFFGGALASDDRASSKSTAQQRKQAAAALAAALGPLRRELAEECPPATGLLTARVRISGETGEVDQEEVEWLADTLVVSPGVCVDGGIGENEARALIQHVVRERLRAVRFPAVGGGRSSSSSSSSSSTATVPLLFE